MMPWTRSDLERIDARDLAGDHKTCLAGGCGKAHHKALGPDHFQTTGACCCFIPFFGGVCVGGEVRKRKENTNDFVHWMDEQNLLRFKDKDSAQCFRVNDDGSETQCPICASRDTGQPLPRTDEEKMLKVVSAHDLAGHYCCTNWYLCLCHPFLDPCLGYIKMQATSEDTLYEGGACVCCCSGDPVTTGITGCAPMPIIAERRRVTIDGLKTNGFVKTDDPNNIVWIKTGDKGEYSGCYGGCTGASCRLAKE